MDNEKIYTEQQVIEAINLAREGKIKQGWDHYVDYTYTTNQIINLLSISEPGVQECDATGAK